MSVIVSSPSATTSFSIATIVRGSGFSSPPSLTEDAMSKRSFAGFPSVRAPCAKVGTGFAHCALGAHMIGAEVTEFIQGFKADGSDRRRPLPHRLPAPDFVRDDARGGLGCVGQGDACVRLSKRLDHNPSRLDVKNSFLKLNIGIMPQDNSCTALELSEIAIVTSYDSANSAPRDVPQAKPW